MSDAHVYRKGKKNLKEKGKEEEKSQRPIQHDGRSRIYLALSRSLKPNKTIIVHSARDRKVSGGRRRERSFLRFFFPTDMTRRRAWRLHAHERDQSHVNLMIADEKRARAAREE